MGEELCKGCQDCTNNNPEDDLSRQQNPPLQYINNPYFMNNKTNNTVNEITQNNNDNPYFLNNKTNNSVNEITQNNNDSFFNNNNHITKTSNMPLYDLEDNKNYKLKSSNDINSTPLEINKDKERLNEIKKNIYSRKITNLFRKYNGLKNASHQVLQKEYSTIPTSEFFIYLNNDDLDVNLAPEINCLYLGTKFNNKKDGLGLEIFEETKSKYFGIFRNGKRITAGHFLMNNDLKEYYYTGEINGIYAWGYGWFENLKKYNYYEGNWKNSMKNGIGIEYYEDNSEYKGTFLNGKKDGIGFYKWVDGSSYEGEWKENKLNGYGIYTFKDGSIYKGEWKGNRMNGIGEFSFPGIKTYIGYFQRDIRCGFGITIWHIENKAFIGFWNNNQQNGIGKFISNNKMKYGIWKDGKLIEKINNKMEFNKRLNNEEIAYLAYLKIDQYSEISQLINQYIDL